MTKSRMKQLIHLLWKNWLLKKRHPVATILEAVLPLITVTVLVILVARSGDELAKTHKRPLTPYHPPIMYDQPTFNFSSNLQISVVGTILMAPANNFTYALSDRMRAIYMKQKYYSLAVIVLEDEDTVVSTWLKRNELKLPFIRGAVIVTSNFTESESTPTDFSYKIRVSDNAEVAQTRLKFPLKKYASPSPSTSYLKTFVPLQLLVNEAYMSIISDENKVEQPKADILLYRAPYPRFLDRPMTGLLDFGPVAIVFGFIISCPLIVKRLIDEKRSKSREMLKLAGLSDSAYWSSVLVSNMAIYVFQAAYMVVMFETKFNGIMGVVSYASYSVLYLIFLSYGISYILFSMLLSIPFQKPVTGMIVSLVVWLVTFIVPLIVLDPFVMLNLDIESTQLPRLLSCVLPNAGLNFALRLVLQKEVYAAGADWFNMFDEVGVFGYFTLGAVLIVQAISIVTMCYLIWYTDKVFNQGRSWLFPLIKIYRALIAIEKVAITGSVNTANQRYFERSVSTAKVCISIKDLVKEYGAGSKRKLAVNGLSLDVPRGKITALLGHNGAGKSTTMAMITGMLEPSSGSVTIDGVNICENKDEARKSVAFCPQHDVLYDELTVSEHLELYGRIRGTMSEAEFYEELNRVVKQIGLASFCDRMAGTLSGGMKRKLSLGCALVGGTKVLILDEPTSGMDVDARRALWDLLLSIRRERTILLTTHYMEEADAVGDMVAIMASGELKCFGSSIFLKRIFGSGYQFRVAKGETFDGLLLNDIVLRYFQRAQLVSDVATEVIYALNNASEDGGQNNEPLPVFFEELEQSEVGIESCGLAMTTMEEVFLKVGTLDIEAQDDGQSESSSVLEAQNLDHPRPVMEDAVTRSSAHSLDLLSVENSKYEENTLARHLQRIKGLYVKRILFCRRYWPSLVFQVVLPAVVFCFLLLLDNFVKNRKNDDPHELGINLGDIYGPSFGFYKEQNETLNDFGAGYYIPGGPSQLVNVTYLHNETTPDDFLTTSFTNISIQEYATTYITGATVVRTADRLSENIYYNNEALHSAPGSVNLFYSARQKSVFPDQNCSLKISNHPFPSETEYLAAIYLVPTLKLLWVLVVPLDGSLSCRQLRDVSGPRIALEVKVAANHDRCPTSRLLVDNHLIRLRFATLELVRHPWRDRIAVLSTLMAFGVASMPISYVVSLWRAKPTSSFSLLVIFYLIGGVTGSILMLVLRMSGVALSETFINMVDYSLKCFPIYSMSEALSKVYQVGSYATVCQEIPESTLDVLCPFIELPNPLFGCCKSKCEPLNECYKYVNPLSYADDGIYSELTYLVATFVLFATTLVLIEYNVVRRVTRYIHQKTYVTLTDEETNEEDDDVGRERSRVEQLIAGGHPSEDAFVVHSLRKEFDNFVPVKRLTVGVHHGECFGLLGVNGAGKTTTFRMLTGDLEPTSGNAHAHSAELLKDLTKYQRNIGYCPQFDAHPTKMTGVEALTLFGRLRGIKEANLKAEVNAIIEMIDLKKHADRLSETYSGGNRRKLSLGLSLIGGPPVLLLDEPTCGVDPTARRKIWAALATVRAHYGSSVVLTSHSMEECECLCSRVGIMVAGRLRCLGAIQHLRAKYGQGYTVTLKLKHDRADDDLYMKNIRLSVERSVPSAALSDAHDTMLTYHVTDKQLTWSQLFRLLESIKNKHELEDYAVSDTTLEQIFISFARSRPSVEVTRC
ncbi:Phospholipid-transporting ATPase ABCA3 [Halotydeus destructor]|nr:Phospholipid-transporting ATPase ABCA3 [Halotydeus destructor]